MDSLQQSILQRYLQLEWITVDRFDQIRTLRLKFQDKPLISFTDLSSMVIMQELNITAILTADAHFSHVGLGFQRAP
jgi:predicted nucleic acid-binding protein